MKSYAIIEQIIGLIHIQSDTYIYIYIYMQTINKLFDILDILRYAILFIYFAVIRFHYRTQSKREYRGSVKNINCLLA